MGRVALVAIAALLLAAGCGERGEPTSSTVRIYPVTVQDARDRPITLGHEARRIAVLAEAPAAILRAIGAGDRIVGEPVDGSGRLDPEQLEQLEQLRPDLIVASEDADEEGLSEVADATGAEVYVAPGDAIKAVERAATQLGLLTGRTVEARAVVRRIEERLREVETRLAREPVLTVFVDTGFFTTVSDQTLIGDLIRVARGTNVAGTVQAPGPFDLRKLAQLDPAVYVATSDSDVTLADLRRNPDTRNLTAVRNGRFVVLDAGAIEPGPDVGDAVVEVARLLHPNAFR